MEIWDVYDKDRRLTSKTMVRGDSFEDGAFHMVVHVCIFNSRGQMLIQQRQPFKSGWPDMWDITVGGSAVAGETSRQAAEREVAEEIGYKIDLRDVRPFLTINFKFGFDDFYILEDDVDIGGLKLQYEEVQRVRWATKDEIMSVMDRKKFIPYHKSFIELLFDMRKGMGAHNKAPT